MSALHFGGRPRQLLEAARAALFDLAISAPVVAETERVLTTRFGSDAEHVAAAVWVLRGFTRLVVPERAIVGGPDDPDDDCILERAVAAGAQVLVSGDQHLLRLGALEGVQIVTAAALLLRFAAGPDVSGTN